MRKTFFLSAAICSIVSLNAAVNPDAVLLTIDGEPSYASEFIYIYNKNNNDSAIEQKTMDEYLDMFVNYKLKVHEAKQLGLDTAQSFIRELQGYRKQLVPPYLTDSAKEAALVRDAYHRKGEDIAVSHIAIQCPPNASAADSLAAYNKISEARQRVTTGIARKKGKKLIPAVPENFADVAREMSQDPSVNENGGYIGWVTPFLYVLPFETAAYNTAVGEVSNIFRSPFGYHILKVEQRIPHIDIHAAHIMKTTPHNDNPVVTDSIAEVAKRKIDSIYAVVKSGDDFASIAIAESEDRGSAANGGDLNWFGRGQMVPEFETVVFELKDSGDISEPVRSKYGWHIIKKLGTRNLQPFEKMRPELQRNVRRSEYSKQIEQSFVDGLKAKYGFKQTGSLQAFYDLAAKYNIGDSLFQAEAAQYNAELISFAGESRSEADFTAFLKANTRTNLGIADKIIDEKFHYFVNHELIAYEESQLENEYPDFRNLMAEYHDGILLFDVSLANVWDKATQDTAGLRVFFEENKSKYKFTEPYFKGRVVYCRDAETMKAAKGIIRNATPDSINSYLNKRLNTDSVPSVKVEKGLWKAGQHKVVDKMGLKVKGAEYEPASDFPFVFVAGKVIKAPMEYNDVRGEVTADYQDYLEKNWIQELRDKYKVVVNRQVFEEIKK